MDNALTICYNEYINRRNANMNQSYYDLFCSRFPQDKAFQRHALRNCCPHWFFDIPYNRDCMTDTCAKCWGRIPDYPPPIK